jgi:hypothetical protein
VRRTSKQEMIGGTEEPKGVGLGVFHLSHRVRTTQVPPTRMIHLIESWFYVYLSYCFLVV